MKLITEFEISFLSPIHIDYPYWPGGERWLQLYETLNGAHIVLTKGLFHSIDFPFELSMETDDLIDHEDFGSSWQANLVYEAGRVVPRVPNFLSRLEKNIFLTLQVDIDGAPDEWSFDSPDGNIGLFIGLKDIESLETDKTHINIKLMRPSELQYSIENDSIGRRKLAELYLNQGEATLSNLERESVI